MTSSILLENAQLLEAFSHNFLIHSMCTQAQTELHLLFSIRTSQAYICDTSRGKTQWSVKYLSDKRLVISMEQVTILQTYPVMVAEATSEDLNTNITRVMM